MNKINSNIYYKKEDISSTNYVELCAGKGKGSQSKIYIDKYSFSYLEGLIWDKFREYGSSNKTKISSNEWKRINEGMETAFEKLDSMKHEELKNVLKFNKTNPKNALEEILDEVVDLKILLTKLIEWIREYIEKEKYILIIKNDK